MHAGAAASLPHTRFAAAAAATPGKVAVPSASQLHWHSLEVGAMFTWNLQTLCSPVKGGRTQKCQAAGWLPTDDEAAAWDPSALDTDEWARVAASFGAKYAVLVADHFSGFALWETATSNYSLAHTPWRGGGADLTAAFVASCRKAGLAPGVFYSAHMNWHEGVVNWRTKDPAKQAAYNELTRAQLTELLRNPKYGNWTEVWFDAGVEGDVNPLVGPTVRALAPTAVCHSCAGFDTTGEGSFYGLRWMGNEEGVMPLPSWGAATNYAPYNGNPRGAAYCPPSVDTVLSEHQWFRQAGYEAHIKPTRTLVDNYLKSVGRAANLILNVAPDATGAIPAADQQAYAAFGQAIKCLFAHTLTDVASPPPSVADPSVTTWAVGDSGGDPLSGVRNVSVSLQEDIADGQLIGNWTLTASVRPAVGTAAAEAVETAETAETVETAGGAGGASSGASGGGAAAGVGWQDVPVVNGTGIGWRRLLNWQTPSGTPLDVRSLTLTVVDSFAVTGQTPHLSRATLYDWAPTAACV